MFHVEGTSERKIPAKTEVRHGEGWHREAEYQRGDDKIAGCCVGEDPAKTM